MAAVLRGFIPHGDGLAVIDLTSAGHRQLSYAWLDGHVGHLTLSLHRAIPDVDHLAVALISPRSAEAVAGWLAIWRRGAVYLPLDHDAPAAILSHSLDIGLAAAILAADSVAAALPAVSIPIVSLESGRTHFHPAQPLAPSPLSSAVAYIICTSGSTGKPKAVLGARRGLMARCEWGWRRFPIERGEVCAARCAHSFVDSLWETLGPLQSGAALLLLGDAMTSSSPARFLRSLRSWRVSRLLLVPQALAMLADACDAELSSDGSAGSNGSGGSGGSESLPHLRLLSISGDSLPLSLVTRIRRLLPRSRLLNLYGSSEVSADCTCYEVEHGLDDALARSHATCPIGSPIAGARLRLVSGVLTSGDVGSADVELHRTLAARASTNGSIDGASEGEILVGGELVALGYLGQPELSAAHFFESGGMRWFRTGDWAARGADGELRFLGRTDGQLQVRGMRVEVAEIEAAYCEHVSAARVAAVPLGGLDCAGADGGGVMGAVVDGQRDDHGRCEGGGPCLPPFSEVDRIILCVELSHASSRGCWASESRADPTPLGGGVELLPALSVSLSVPLAEWGSKRLPEAARPTAFAVIRNWPMLASGKVDRRALRLSAPAMLRALACERKRQRDMAASQPTQPPPHPPPQPPPNLQPQSDPRSDESPDATVALCAILSELLGQQVWPDETLAEVGVTSVVAAQLAHALEQRCGWVAPLEALVRSGGGTLRGVGACLLRRSEALAAAREVEARETAYASAALTPELWAQTSLAQTMLSAERSAVAGSKRQRGPAVCSASTASADGLAVAWVHGKASSAAASDATQLHAAAEEEIQLSASWRVDLGKCVDASPLLVCTMARVSASDSATAATEQQVLCLCGSHAGRLVAVELPSGHVRWNARLPDRIEAACCVIPSSDDGEGVDGNARASEAAASMQRRGAIVLVGSHDDHTHALSLASGQRLWSVRCRGAVKAAAVELSRGVCPRNVCSRAALTACFGGQVLAFDVTSGRELWASQELDGPVFATPLDDGTRIMVADLRGGLHCWSREGARATQRSADVAISGFTRPLPLCLTKIWRFTTSPRASNNAASAFAGAEPIFSSPTLSHHGGGVTTTIFGCTDGYIYSVRTSDGTCVWKLDVQGGPIFCAPCVLQMGQASAGVLITASHSGRLYCVRATDGGLLWSSAGKYTGHSAPAESGGIACACDVDGGVHLFRASDGQPLGVHALPAAVFSSPVLHAGRVVVGCREDGLWCLTMSPPTP